MGLRSVRHLPVILALLVTIIGVSACRHPTAPKSTPALSSAPIPAAVPRPAHVVVVIFENAAYSDIVGSPDAPYLNSLAHRGVELTHSYAVTHPSQPNYLALFSGSTQGVTSDACLPARRAQNLGGQLLSAGHGYRSYAEGLPSTGFHGCSAGGYARKHAPWTDFADVPARTQQPLRSFPSNFATLPDVSFVVPDLCHSMHDCSVRTGDNWLKSTMDAYRRWAMTHDSLLLVTFDEGTDTPGGGHILTMLTGRHVRPGRYGERVDHYTVLRTLEAMYGLPGIGNATHRTPITDVWTR